MKRKYTVKYVNELSDSAEYPTKTRGYLEAHKKANASEKKLDPKMYKREEHAERKALAKHPKQLMADHDKRGDVQIEKKFKRFTKTLTKHERTEWKADKAGRKRKSSSTARP
jgi:hypothetical protein